MAEEEKKEEESKEDSKESEDEKSSDNPIEKANAAAERLEKANKQKEKLISKEEKLAAERALGGQSIVRQEAKKAELSPEEYANKVRNGEISADELLK